MNYNTTLKEFVYSKWQTHFKGAFENGEQDGNFDELGNINTAATEAVHYDSFKLGNNNAGLEASNTQNPFIVRTPKISMFEAANQIIIKYKTTFRPITRFRAAAHLILIRIAKNKARSKVLTYQLSRLLSTESRRLSQHFGPEGQFWLVLPDWSKSQMNVFTFVICFKLISLNFF